VIIKRDLYMDKIRGFVDQPEIVKVLTGIRRSGKSVMLDLIKAELEAQKVPPPNMLTYNFEDLRLVNLLDYKELHNHLHAEISSREGRVYLFLDELQEVDNWEACINSLRSTLDVDIYITGSNSKMLAGEYATHLAGRYIAIQMFPFSYQEFLVALTKSGKALISQRESFGQYLAQGGMPFSVNIGLSESDSKQYLRDVFSSVVIKDIVKRNSFRDVDLLERIITYVMANVGKTFSANSISKYFKSEKRTVSPETIMNYLKACEEAFLFERIKRMDVIGKRMLKVDEKFYVADHGLRNAVVGGNEQAVELIFENIVCLELLRRGYSVLVGRIGSQEIDFVAEKDGDTLYVQVCYLLASEDTVEREFGALESISDNYPKYVVSDDNYDMSRNGIKHRNICDFLLSSEW